MFDSTKRKLPRRRPTTRLILHRANAYNQNIQALAAKEGCGSLSRTFQIFQEGVSEFAVIFPATRAVGRKQGTTSLKGREIAMNPRQNPAYPPGGRCPGDVEVGTAEHRRQSRHDESVPAGAQPRASLALLFPDRGGLRSKD